MKLAGEFSISLKIIGLCPNFIEAEAVIRPNCPPPKMPILNFFILKHPLPLSLDY